MQALNNKLILFGGQDTTGAYYNDVWYYNETVNSWYPGPSLPGTARRGDMSCVVGGSYYYTCGLGVGDQRLKETWTMDVPVGIIENSRANCFSISPNPVQDFLTLKLSLENLNEKNIQLSLVDANGREVKQLNIENIAEGNALLNLTDLDQGVYFLKIYSQKKLLEVKKLIKD